MGPFVIDRYNMALCAIVTLGMQTTFFIIAATCKFDKVTDLAGGSNFVVIALLTFFLAQTYGAQQIAITIFIILWGVRLSGYLLYRIIKIGEDKRFDDIRKQLLKFAVFWFFQALWAFTVSLPVIFINAAINFTGSDFGALDIIGTILFIFGLIIETVADQQKFKFRIDPDNKGKWCATGLWYWSRHPNYLGEMTLWLGVFFMSCSILNSAEWLAILGPIFLFTTLLFVTGMPVLEKKSDERYKSRNDYQAYKEQTSPILFLPTNFYRALSPTIKCIFFCEFPFYTSQSTQAEQQPVSQSTQAEQQPVSQPDEGESIARS